MTEYRIRLERVVERYDEEMGAYTGEWDVLKAWGFKFKYEWGKGADDLLIRLSNTLAVDNGLVFKQEN